MILKKIRAPKFWRVFLNKVLVVWFRKRPLGRPRHRWEDRMDLRDIGCEIVYWMHLVQERDQWQTFVNMLMNPRFQRKGENFLTS
jgi:hypothetical protein